MKNLKILVLVSVLLAGGFTHRSGKFGGSIGS